MPTNPFEPPQDSRIIAGGPIQPFRLEWWHVVVAVLFGGSAVIAVAAAIVQAFIRNPTQ
jgi:hypothetical protein